MTQKQRLQIIKSHQWKEEEATLSLHILDHFKTCHLEGRSAFQKELYSVSIYAIENGYGFEWVQRDEAREVLAWALGKYRKNPGYFQKKMGEFFKVSLKIEKLSAIFQQGLRRYSSRELAALLLQICALGKKQYGYSLLPEGLDTLEQKDYLNLLPNVKGEEVPYVIARLSTPEEQSFLEREKLDLLILTKSALKTRSLKEAVRQNSLKAIKKFPSFFKRIQMHKKKYFWIQNSFKQAFYLDEKYFLGQIRELVNNMSEKDLQKEIDKLQSKKKIIQTQGAKIYRKYKISRQTQFFFELSRLFTMQQDQRKENVQRLVFCIDQIWQEAEKRHHVSKTVLDNYFVSELAELLKKGKIVLQSELDKRKKLVFFSYIKNNEITTDILVGKEAAEIMNFFKKRRENLGSSHKIKGFVASRGKKGKIIQGKVRIVFNPEKDTFKAGEILVTGMTRPEFVPLMKKAKAIITNEGGITTHAAIISRELGVPCIIGTKIATDVLKNGDLIQLDLKQGIIKILKR